MNTTIVIENYLLGAWERNHRRMCRALDAGEVLRDIISILLIALFIIPIVISTWLAHFITFPLHLSQNNIPYVFRLGSIVLVAFRWFFPAAAPPCYLP